MLAPIPAASIADGHIAPERISRRTACILLFAIVAVAAWLRWRGYDAELPHTTQADVLAIARQVDLIRSGTEHPELGPNWAYYSLFVARVVAMLPRPDPSTARTLDEHLACAGLLFTQVRLLSILISILAVPATYLLARYFLDRVRSLFAAGLIATSLLHAYMSATEKPHSIVTTFVLFGMLAALRLARKPTFGSYALCGIAGAAAFGALQNGLMILPAFAAAHFLRRKGGSFTRASAWIGVCILLAILALGWQWLWPARPPGPPGEHSFFTVTMTGQAIHLENLDGMGAVRMVNDLWGADPLLVTLAAIGLVCGAVFGLARAWKSRTWRPIAVVLASVLPYALVTGLYSVSAGRYVMPLVPFVACLAASAIPFRFAAPACALLIVPLVPVWRWSQLRVHPDTTEEAAAFIAKHVPPEDTVILIPVFDLPLFTDERTTRANAALPWATWWAQYMAKLDSAWIEGGRHAILILPSSGTKTPRRHVTGNLSYFQANGARWVVARCEAGPQPLREDITTLRTQAKLVARFSPLVDDDGRDVTMPPLDPDLWPGPFPRAWKLLGARAAGPTLEVYRLP